MTAAPPRQCRSRLASQGFIALALAALSSLTLTDITLADGSESVGGALLNEGDLLVLDNVTSYPAPCIVRPETHGGLTHDRSRP